jgi:hypothetical protein
MATEQQDSEERETLRDTEPPEDLLIQRHTAALSYRKTT